MNNFVPLRIISCYSFLKSGLTMAKINRAVVKNDYFGLGICDKGVMFGVPSFVKTSEAAHRPYLIGLEVSLEEDTFCLYAISEEGYHHLIEISTAIQKNEFSLEFLKQRTSGLIAVMETYGGKFKQLLSNDDSSFAKYLFDYSELFKNSFYLGLEVISKDDVSYANKVRQFAKEHTYDVVALPRILYEKKDDAIVLEIVKAIANDAQLEDKSLDGQQYFMPMTFYQKIYRPKEIENTKKILEASSFNFHQKRGEMLHYPVENSEQALKDNCFKALEELGLKDKQDYIDRLNYELETIISLGYADYFLIVQDYVGYAKKTGILVGPGRGSASGSLVSYLLNITQIDPLKNDLQFERFLNPYRKTMPDIDVDFMDIRREDVVQYMRDKYGNERVANIVTFQTIQAKQSLRDIGRVYGYPTSDIDLLSKRITSNVSLREAYKTLPAFKSLVDSDNYYLEIVSLASKIEGLIRQNSLHAAGIILNNSPLENALPVITDSSGHYISQYEMGSLEDQGFLKMDFLGLTNLTTIARCVDLINMHHLDANLDKQHLPYDEPSVYELIATGQTMGVFQIESSGMKRAIKVLRPTCFDDIVALLALFRHGPMDEINTYARRKHGEKPIIYDDPCLEPILKSTYGVIVYQEQVNKIATTLAGFSMAEADLFRSAISKKKIDKMLEGEKAFVEGAIKNGHSQKVATKIFESIKKFSQYAFNKSHSVAYSTIACQMAYLKAHYPLEFYAAILETSSATNDSKFNEYVSEMKRRNIAIISPNINKSMKNFIVYNNGLLFPLNAIRGINEVLASKIIEERDNGEYKDFFDFVARMYQYRISENHVLSLIDAGCFDEFVSSRASLRASVKSALQYAELTYREDGQMDLGVSAYLKPYLIQDNDDPIDNLDREYEAIGIMLSNNPLHYKADLLKSKNIVPIADAKEQKNAKIAGLIRSIKVIQKKSTMAFVKLADESDEIELKIFASVYTESVELLEKNRLIIVEISKELYNDNVDYIAKNIAPLEDD